VNITNMLHAVSLSSSGDWQVCWQWHMLPSVHFHLW